MASQNKKCSARVTIDFSSDEGKDVDLVISLRRRGAQEGPPPTANEVAVSVASGSTCNWAMVRDDKATSKSSPDKQKETDSDEDSYVVPVADPEGKYPLNFVSETHLWATKGIGKVLAGKIIQARPIREWRDLMLIHGLGNAKLGALQEKFYL